MRDVNSATPLLGIAVNGGISADLGPQVVDTSDGAVSGEPPNSGYLARLAFQAKERRARRRPEDRDEASR